MKNAIYKLAEVLYKFIALNVLWVMFCLLGLGIFGFMPATLALFRVIRKWINGNEDIRLFSDYFRFYKTEFLRSNLIGLMFALIFYVIYVNYSFVPYFYHESIHLYIYLVILGVATMVVMTFINIFSVMAHFEHKLLHYLKLAVGLVFAHPGVTALQIIWLLAYFIILIQFPKVSIVIGVSVFAYVIMSINYRIFNRYTEA